MEPKTHPPCVVCDGDVVRARQERRDQWLRRRTCSPVCKHDLLAGRQRAREHPPCVACAEPVPRRPREQLGVWLSRKTCGPECLAKTRAGQTGAANTWRWVKWREAAAAQPHAPCTVCRRPVEIREGEKPNIWRKRKTCGRECLGKLRAEAMGAGRARSLNPKARKPGAPAERPAAAAIRRSFARLRKPAAPVAVRFETVAEALARGVVITEIKAPPPVLGGVPVRSKASRWGVY